MAKTQFIRARVAAWEKYVIQTNAAKAKMPESEFVRTAALNKDVTVIDGLNEFSSAPRPIAAKPSEAGSTRKGGATKRSSFRARAEASERSPRRRRRRGRGIFLFPSYQKK